MAAGGLWHIRNDRLLTFIIQFYTRPAAPDKNRKAVPSGDVASFGEPPVSMGFRQPSLGSLHQPVGFLQDV